MAKIEVRLTDEEIRQACEYWATNRILNEGRALSSELTATVCHGEPTGTLNGCTVWVETDRMNKSS